MESYNKQYHPSVNSVPVSAGRPFFQPKLTINNPNDKFEKEADAVADKVMQMETSSVQKKSGTDSFFLSSPFSITPLQRKCDNCKEEEKMQRKEIDGEETTADSSLENYVGGLSSAGQPLPNETRNFYEPRFGYDFGNVKIHTGTVAAKSAQSINALAYTSGSNIVFNDGQYAPGTDSGKRLLGHELTHVIQQGNDIQPKKIQRILNVNPIGETAYVAGLLSTICDGVVNYSGNNVTSDCVVSSDNSCGCVCDVTSDPTRIYTIEVRPQSATTNTETLWDGSTANIPSVSPWPNTRLGTDPVVTIHSASGQSVEVGAFSSSGSAFYYDAWRILAHELCGHARLYQSQGGATGNRPGHNSTIDTENDIAFEHGPYEMRGHYGDPRQGESFWNPIGNNSRIAFKQRNGMHYEAP